MKKSRITLAGLFSISMAITTAMVSPSASADDAPGTMQMIVNNNSVLKYVIPQNSDPGMIACFTNGNTNAANQFIGKYGTQDVIWADQIAVTFIHGGSMTYNARISAGVGGAWIHQYYEMTATYQRSCFVSARLTGESRD